MILATVLPGISAVEDGAGAVHKRSLLSLLGFNDSVPTTVVPGNHFSASASSASLTSFSGTYTTLSPTSTFAAEGLHNSEPAIAVFNTYLPETTPSPSMATLQSDTATLPTIYAAAGASDHTNKTWQIFGIAVIAVLFVVACITSAMFFDHIWTFLREAIRCKTHPDNLEVVVPDWDKQLWKAETSSSSFTIVEACEHKARTRELPWDTENP